MKEVKDYTETNKLIAEFMGAKKSGGSTTAENFGLIHQYEVKVMEGVTVRYWEQPCWCGSPDRLQYHTLWDWLMPVVEKIWDASTEHTREFMGLQIFELGLFADIQTVYVAVVQFITWYNQQQLNTPNP